MPLVLNDSGCVFFLLFSFGFGLEDVLAVSDGRFLGIIGSRSS